MLSSPLQKKKKNINNDKKRNSMAPTRLESRECPQKIMYFQAKCSPPGARYFAT